jgi:hypothetical protein
MRDARLVRLVQRIPHPILRLAPDLHPAQTPLSARTHAVRHEYLEPAPEEVGNNPAPARAEHPPGRRSDKVLRHGCRVFRDYGPHSRDGAASAIGKVRRDPYQVQVIHEIVGVPLCYFRVLAACEAAGAVGVFLGILWPPLGLVAGIGLVIYFVGAVVAHLRVGDVKGGSVAYRGQGF